jgi:hypothetical protein
VEFDHNAFWIYSKDPSVQAFTDLMNRALDKTCAEQKKLTKQVLLLEVMKETAFQDESDATPP